MSIFQSILFMALLVGQTSGFIAADKSSKAVGALQSALQSTYNRNYEPAGGYGYDDRSNDGMRGSRYNDYDQQSHIRGGDYNRGRYNEYDRGYNSFDRGYGGMSNSRSKYSDWLNGSSNYIPTSANRNYVMDRGYETNGGRYSNYYNDGDRLNNRYNSGYNERYSPQSNNRYSSDRYSSRNSMDYNGRNSMDYNGRNSMDYNGRNSMDYNRRNSMDYNGRNSMDYNRFSPISNNSRNYGSNIGGEYNRNSDRASRSNEYERTRRSLSDSHRQDYPSYTMGRMEDQFGYKKWWDSN